MFDVDWWSLLLPFAYIFVLGSSLYVFSTIYRKRKAGMSRRSLPSCSSALVLPADAAVFPAQAANLAPWFPPHLQKEVYSTLLELHADKESKTKIPDSVLRAALLRRAVEDIGRIIQVRQAKQALNTLLQRGSVGEDLNQRFQRAEKEIEEELKDVVMEVSACPWPTLPEGDAPLLNSMLTSAPRPTPLPLTGVRPSSSRPTRSLPTPCCARGSRTFRPKPPPSGNGGRSAAR